MTADDKLTFLTGSIFTFTMSATLYDIFMALVLGIVGGFAGMVGKHVFYFFKDIWQNLKDKHQ